MLDVQHMISRYGPVTALHDASFEFCPVKTILKSYVIVSFNSPVIKSAPKLSTVNLSLYSPVRLAEKVNESVSYSKLNDVLISSSALLILTDALFGLFNTDNTYLNF